MVAARAFTLLTLCAVLASGCGRAPKSYAKTAEPGLYRCSRCSSPLFRSSDKFASNTRWPSFRQAVEGSVVTRPDHSEGLDRTEVLCARCSLHLGHVFKDGKLTGDSHPDAKMRYCVLSASLDFQREGALPK